MATIQSKKSKGHKYWYIVESRRVDGKSRPIVLAYLGKAEDLLDRLNQSVESLKLKSYSHGGVAAMLKKAPQDNNRQSNENNLPEEGYYLLDYHINYEQLKQIEDQMGFRILMTNRQEWDTAKIIKSFYDQSLVESAFREMKNPYHLAIPPQYHWTDQKIRVHFFICVLGYLLSTLVWKELKEKIGYNKSINTMINTLNNIRLATIIEDTNNPGKLKAYYKLKEIEEHEKQIVEALNLGFVINSR